jgi:hypothetical protein
MGDFPRFLIICEKAWGCPHTFSQLREIIPSVSPHFLAIPHFLTICEKVCGLPTHFLANYEKACDCEKAWADTNNESRARVFKNPPMAAFRRPRNLKDIIIRTRLDNPLPIGGFTTCTDKRCLMCKFSRPKDTFSSSVTWKSYKILGTTFCHTNNCIYLKAGTHDKACFRSLKRKSCIRK